MKNVTFKRSLVLVCILFAFVFGLTTCNNDATSSILEIREGLFATIMNDITINPRLYLGETIRMEGMFKHNRWQGRDIYRIYRFGPGCCGEDEELGFEFSWDSDYPSSNTFSSEVPLPRPDDWIEIVGVISSYQISGFPFLYVAITELNFPDRRGAETVNR